MCMDGFTKHVFQSLISLTILHGGSVCVHDKGLNLQWGTKLFVTMSGLGEHCKDEKKIFFSE